MEYKTIENQMKKKLIDIGKTPAELARMLNLTPQAFCNYYKGRVKIITPEILGEMVNDGIERLMS
jgi:hypothetical protein